MPNDDPWTRSHDSLALATDFAQVDEIEHRRRGGPLTFIVRLGGVVHHDSRIGNLRPANHTLRYEIGSSDWQRVLNQLAYGTYLNVEVPLTLPNGVSDAACKAGQALQEALSAFRRGAYEEAVADCRPGLDAFRAADKGKIQPQARGPKCRKG
jgi:hypothetical protein